MHQTRTTFCMIILTWKLSSLCFASSFHFSFRHFFLDGIFNIARNGLLIHRWMFTYKFQDLFNLGTEATTQHIPVYNSRTFGGLPDADAGTTLDTFRHLPGQPFLYHSAPFSIQVAHLTSNLESNNFSFYSFCFSSASFFCFSSFTTIFRRHSNMKYYLFYWKNISLNRIFLISI